MFIIHPVEPSVVKNIVCHSQKQMIVIMNVHIKANDNCFYSQMTSKIQHLNHDFGSVSESPGQSLQAGQMQRYEKSDQKQKRMLMLSHHACEQFPIIGAQQHYWKEFLKYGHNSISTIAHYLEIKGALDEEAFTVVD